MTKRHTTLLPIEQLKQCVVYDPLTGHMEKRLSDKTRYRAITVNGQTYPAHWVAWAISKGSWPTSDIDHINGDRTDNRIENLREVSHSKNIQNQREAQASNKSSGLLGVALRKNGKWDARIWVDGRNLYLGCFDVKEEAHQAYLTAKRKKHPGCTL